MPLSLGSDWSAYTQKNRLLKAHSDVFPDDTLLLDEFSGMEAVSSPFRFILSMISEQEDLDLKDFMAGAITVSIETASREHRYFHGHVSRFAQTGVDGHVAFYEAILSPWIEFMRHQVQCRIFQEKSVIDILETIFQEYSNVARYEIRAIKENYKPLTFCVQYNESDLDFVSRLMEEYGLYYFFEFPENEHVLIVADDSTSCDPMPMHDTIDYNDESGVSQNDTISALGSARQLVSNHFSTKTFDFKNPRDPMKTTTETNHNMGDLPRMEWYEHVGPYTYKDDRGGDRWVKLRIEEQELRSKSFHGTSNVRFLTCGHAFQLNRYDLLGNNADDRTFFVINVVHHAVNNFLSKQPVASYSNQFVCIRKKIPFRPGRNTPKPVMAGHHTATVVGPEGEEIFTDKYGRIKIQFHWDREGQFDAESSCWVRVATPWAGHRMGSIAIPRVKSEVLVTFLNGDPDRPLVTGQIYNELNMPPWELPTNKTQWGVYSNSTPNGGYENANALRFEDQKGSEEVWLQAEKTMRIEVKADENHSVGGDRTKTVTGKETSVVEKDQTETVGDNRKVTVEKGNNITSVTGGGCTIEVGVTNNETPVSGEYFVTSQTIKLKAASQITLTCGENSVVMDPSRITLTCGPSSIVMDSSGIKIEGPIVSLNT